MPETISLVTGATSGLGKAIALGLAQHGCQVVIVGRDRGRAEATVGGIKDTSGNPRIDYLLADLSSQGSIRQLVEAFKRKYSVLHILVNNAGVYKSSRTVSPDGLESMFATNHLAYFLLSTLLLEVLKASAPASIFNVTAPSTTQLAFDDLQGEKHFSSLHAFGASKAANLLFTYKLARELQGTGVVVNAYHPGLVRTSLMREAAFPINVLANLFAAPPEKAAKGLVELAVTYAHGQTGKFFKGTTPIDSSAYTRDEQVQDRLWAESVKLAG